MARISALGPYEDSKYSKQKAWTDSFEIVFGCLMPTGVSKPSIPGLNDYYGNLSEQFDAMTSYIQKLTSILEAYRQQVKEAWPPPSDKACHPFRPGDRVYIKAFRRKHAL